LPQNIGPKIAKPVHRGARRVNNALQKSTKANDDFLRICTLIQVPALGWSDRRICDRLREIQSFCNLIESIALKRRASIGRSAAKLVTELDGLGGLDESFLRNLQVLASKRGRNIGKGGDRRSGQRGIDQSVLGMAVRLYIEASEKVGFAEYGPLFRFANAVGELMLRKANAFSNNAVKAELRRARQGTVRRPIRRNWYLRWFNQTLK